MKLLVAQLPLSLCNPRESRPPAPLSMEFSGKNIGVGCHSHLQGIFPTEGPNPGLTYCRQILYHLSHQGIYIKVRQRVNSLFLSWDAHLLSSGIRAPGSRVFRLRLNYGPCFLGCLPCKWQILGLPSLHKHV